MNLDFLKYLRVLFILSLMLFTGLINGQFQHPGIFSSKAELEFVKQKIDEGKEPWKTAFNKLKQSNPTTRNPKAHKVVPGSSDPKERKDMDAMTLDGSHAYASALLFYFTGEKKYANYAIKVLNAWNIFRKNGMPLYTTWSAPHFINAAELIKHTPNSGWEKADMNKFDVAVREGFTNLMVHPKDDIWGANHGATAIETRLAAAVYLDDKKMFDDAIRQWKKHISTYLYLNKNGRLDGQCLETCRDLNHVKLGSLGIMYAANTAYHQGVDLWKEQETRLIKFAELHAGMMTGRTKVPSNLCRERGQARAGVVYCRGGVKWATPSGTPPCNETPWEILYNHLGTRLGNNLPHTKAMLETSRPLGNINKRNSKWETLLHANMNPEKLDPGTPTGPGPGTGTPEGPEGYTFATDEKGIVEVSGNVNIAYGANGKFTIIENVSADTPCTNERFGDPIPGVAKSCFVKEAVPTLSLNTIGENAANEVSLVPNPSNGSFRLNSNALDKANVKIYNLSGQLIVEKEATSTSLSIDEQSVFNSGIYLVKITTISGGTLVKKLIVK